MYCYTYIVSLGEILCDLICACSDDLHELDTHMNIMIYCIAFRDSYRGGRPGISPQKEPPPKSIQY